MDTARSEVGFWRRNRIRSEDQEGEPKQFEKKKRNFHNRNVAKCYKGKKKVKVTIRGRIEIRRERRILGG
jgi:hypothetical protein